MTLKIPKRRLERVMRLIWRGTNVERKGGNGSKKENKVMRGEKSDGTG